MVESPRPVHHVDLISWLLSKGAPVNLPDIAGLTALHHVVMNNRVEGILIALLKGGANPNAQDKYGDLPLHHAMMCGQAEAVEALLEYGADLTIREPNDCAPIDILLGCVPEVHAVVQKWQLKQAGITAPLEAGRRVCVVCGKEGKSQCAKCRVVRYCSRECQGESKAILTWYTSHTLLQKLIGKVVIKLNAFRFLEATFWSSNPYTAVSIP